MVLLALCFLWPGNSTDEGLSQLTILWLTRSYLYEFPAVIHSLYFGVDCLLLYNGLLDNSLGLCCLLGPTLGSLFGSLFISGLLLRRSFVGLSSSYGLLGLIFLAVIRRLLLGCLGLLLFL